MDRGTWWATVHRVSKSQTGLMGLSTYACTLIPNKVISAGEISGSLFALGPTFLTPTHTKCLLSKLQIKINIYSA